MLLLETKKPLLLARMTVVQLADFNYRPIVNSGTAICSIAASPPFTPIKLTAQRKKRHVHFAPLLHTVQLYIPTQPTCLLGQPLQRIVLQRKTEAIDWLSMPRLLRQEPFTALDNIWMEQHCEEEEIVGEVAVFNLDPFKIVTIRYSFDQWKTIHDVEARYIQSMASLRIDKFRFRITQEVNQGTLEMAVKYCVKGNEYWDNCNGINHQFCIKLDPF